MRPEQKSEQISYITHFAGFIAGIAGAILLASMTAGYPKIRITAMIYIFSLIFLFAASSIYHRLKHEENGTSLLRKLDHLAIFFMIAGTYTPLCVIYLDGYWRITILAVQWSLVFLGIIFKFLWINAPRKLTTGIYLIMGWVAVIPFHKLVKTMPSDVLVLVITGGLFYTIGAVIYAIRKPNIIPDYFGFHEIFHIFILFGAGTHFAAIVESVIFAKHIFVGG